MAVRALYERDQECARDERGQECARQEQGLSALHLSAPTGSWRIARKISGGTRSAQGTRTRLDVTSVFQTWHAHGLNPFLACYSLLHSGLPQL